MNHLLQIFQVLLVVSMIVVCMWLLGNVLGRKAGYRWRKRLWFLLVTILLITIPLSFTGIKDVARGLKIQVDIPEEIKLPDSVRVLQDATYSVIPVEDGFAEDIVENKNAEIVPEVDNVKGNIIRADSFSLAKIIVVIWIVGAFILFCVRIWQYHFLKKRYMAESIECSDSFVLNCRDRVCAELGTQKKIPVRMFKTNSTTLNSPMLFGYFNTVLLLPYIQYEAQELEAIMRHELTHYRLKDLWYKFFVMMVCDIYWFNPILRLMEKMAFHDVEFVCDKCATASLDLEAKKGYSSTILKTMSGNKGANTVFATRFAGNKRSAKERFEHIFGTHSAGAGMIFLCVLLVAVVVGVIGVSFSISEKEDVRTESTETSEPVKESNSQTADKKTITINANLLPGNWETVLNNVQEKHPEYAIDALSDAPINYFSETFFEQEPTVFSVSCIDTLGLAKDEKIADITDVLAARGWLEQMDDAAKATVSDESGRVYGIPTPNAYIYGVVVNVDLFEEVGLVDENGVPLFPATWEELAQTAARIKEATGQPGLCLIAGEEDYSGCLHFMNMVWNYGTTEVITQAEDGSIRTHLDSDAAIAAMEFVKDLKWKYDVLTEDPTQETYLSGYEHLANGTAAMYLGCNDALTLAVSYGMDAGNLAMGAIPAGPYGEQYSYWGDAVYVFSADATDEEINVALSLLEEMGFGPEADAPAKERIRSGVQRDVEVGGIAIREIPVWKNEGLLAYEQEVLQELGNTNPAFYESFFSKIQVPGNRKCMDTVANSELCMELGKVLKTVMTNPDADVAQLMHTANENWQVFVEHYIKESVVERMIAY